MREGLVNSKKFDTLLRSHPESALWSRAFFGKAHEAIKDLHTAGSTLPR